jgi:elongation factor P
MSVRRLSLISKPFHPNLCRSFSKEGVAKVRPGSVIELDGRLHTIISSKHVTQGRGGAHINLEMRDLQNNIKSLKRFGSDEKVETVALESAPFTLLYRDGSKLILMNSESYEQTEVDEETVDEGERRFLSDGMMVTVRMHSGQPLAVEIPLKVSCEVVEELGTLGGQGPTSKTVRLDNGVEVKCPAFVSVGDRIVVKTTDASYVERA